MGSRSKQGPCPLRMPKTWEAYCEACGWHCVGELEAVEGEVEAHQLVNVGHLVHVVSDWQPL